MNLLSYEIHRKASHSLSLSYSHNLLSSSSVASVLLFGMEQGVYSHASSYTATY